MIPDEQLALRQSIFSRFNEVDDKLTDLDETITTESLTAWQSQAAKTVQGHLIQILNILNNFDEPRP